MIKKCSIRLGNQTSFSSPVFDTPFDFAIVEGFSAFEFFPDKKEDGSGWSVSDISKKQRRLIKKKALESDTSISLHLPWQANPLNDDFNSLAVENILFGADIGASLVVIHLYTEQGIDAYVKAILPVIAETGKRGMRLAIENTPLTSPSEFNILFEMVNGESAIVSGRVGMCLDIGHANLHESHRNDYLAYMDSLGVHVPIIHGHMHENYGESDSHLTLFTGPSQNNHGGVLGVVKRLVGKDFDGALIFEQWPEPPSLLVDAKRELEKIVLSLLPKAAASEEQANTSLEPGSLIEEFLALDRKSRSWRGKLNGLLEILTREGAGDEHFALAAIYLSFIGRGNLNLSEDGGHYRPSHHARAAKTVEKRLSELASSENYFILKKIYPWLPSHDKKFTVAEPLTHIRDIAHRNDIPRDLKDEIKHTLQNKLHRCAGPEDLVTSERILKRITAQGASYSPSFVDEFITFHKELKEFFNAESLTELLEKIIRDGDIKDVEQIEGFIRLRNEAKETVSHLMKLLGELTKLRRLFFPLHWKKSDERAQKVRLADIALDSLAFVLSGRINNTFSEGSQKVSKKEITGLSLLIENIGMNKIYPKECEAIRNDIQLLGKGFSNGRRDDLLRLRASLERVIRVTDSHAERVLRTFQEQAVKLGQGVKVGQSAVRFFSEGSIRGDLIFQLAKYAYFLMKTTKGLLKLPDWDTLFSGEAVGTLTESGEAGFTYRYDENVILVASDISGDEEIPPGVTGIILKKSIPLLSHLGIRAREQGIVFVICEDEEIENKYSEYLGRVVKLTADVKRFDVKPFVGKIDAKDSKRSVSVKLEKPELADENSLIGLDRVSCSNAGGKAYGLKVLKELSVTSGFKVPETVVLPFGAFELSLKNNPGVDKELRFKKKGLGQYGVDEDILRSIREVIGRVENEVSGKDLDVFKTECPLVVRSSSNSEDLDNFAGAGLYESVLNVKRDSLSGAMKRVYASLWTGRAARTRVKEGLPHNNVYMAAIIQEMHWPELSFVIHSVNPITGDEGEMYLEIAPGHGDILTSLSEKGRPYRVSVTKGEGEITIDSFASFSNADLPDEGGLLSRRCVDYSKIRFHTDADFRDKLIRRLFGIGLGIEECFGLPQDIEGFLKDGELYIVQSRSQTILNSD